MEREKLLVHLGLVLVRHPADHRLIIQGRRHTSSSLFYI
jgi:hypothetical protein